MLVRIQLTSQLQYFSGEVLQDCSRENSCLGTNSNIVLSALFQETVDTADWELQHDI